MHAPHDPATTHLRDRVEADDRRAAADATAGRMGDDPGVPSGLELVAGRRTRLRRALDLVEEPFERAAAVCAERLDARDVAVHLVDAPDECIPEWGIGGTTWGPRSVVLAVDPEHPVDPEHVFSTLVHEVHHAMRWRGPGCGTSLRERLVTEGLAQAFEADCTGAVPLYAQGEVTDEHRSLALAALEEDPADDLRWFFGARDLPRWFGYRLGHRLVVERLAAWGSDPCATVHEPASSFL